LAVSRLGPLAWTVAPTLALARGSCALPTLGVLALVLSLG
jgi:hypothetical protein